MRHFAAGVSTPDGEQTPGPGHSLQFVLPTLLELGHSIKRASVMAMAKATRGEATIEIGAAPEPVYELVADITRTGEWSPECYRCEWVEGSAGPTVGARFRGHNRIGPIRWKATGRVVVADPGREFAFSTFKRDQEETKWRYRFAATTDGTRVIESYEHVWAPWYIRFADLFMPRDKQLSQGMKQTLGRIKAAVESASD